MILFHLLAQAAPYVPQVYAPAPGMSDLEKVLIGAIGIGLLSIGGIVGWSIKTAFPQILGALAAIPVAIKSFEGALAVRDANTNARLEATTVALNGLTTQVGDLERALSDKRFSAIDATVGEVLAKVREQSIPEGGAPLSPPSQPMLPPPPAPSPRATLPSGGARLRTPTGGGYQAALPAVRSPSRPGER